VYVGNLRGFDPYGTRIVSGLLSFLTGQPEIAGDLPDICTTVRLVAGERPAVVLSKGGCTAQVSVVHLDLSHHVRGTASRR
jgi:hypothetical protein